MKNIILVFFGIIAFSFCKAQTTSDFEKSFNQTALNKFSDKDIDSLYSKYNHVLFWFNSNAQLVARMKNLEISAYPLEQMKESKVYQNNIDILLADSASKKHTLGCLLVGATNDTLRRNQISNVLVKSSYKNFWATTVLTYLQPSDLSEIVKSITVANNTDFFSYLLNDFLKMDAKILDKFGRDSLWSNNKLVQYLSIRALSLSPNTPNKEENLKKIILHGDSALKGWAIAVLSHLNAGNMLTVLKPYLQNKDLMQVSYRAISRSNSEEDRIFIDNEIAKDSLSQDLLRALLDSENKISVKKWLILFKNNRFPMDYYVNIYRNEIIKQEDFFNDVVEIVKTNQNEQQIFALMDYFNDRNDKKSIEFLKSCSTHKFVSVREKSSNLLGKQL